MKRIVLLAAALLAPGLAQAAGVGASVNTHDAAVYLPIDIGPGLFVEPYFQYSQVKDETGFTTTKTTSALLGAGAFVHRAPLDHVQIYVGGRLAYVKEKLEVGPPVNTTNDQDGFRIEPTIGAAYLVNDRVSIAIEEFVSFQNISGSGLSSKSAETGNRILLRIFLPPPESRRERSR